MTEGLEIAPGFELPLDYVTQVGAVLAVRRAGKSNLMAVLAEEMYKAGLQWIVIDPKGDWWGVQAAGADGSPGMEVVVFGGRHGNVPLEATSGAFIARLVVEQRLSCVIDISGFPSKAAQRRFLTDFAQTLYQEVSTPTHLFLEEVDRYAPQTVRGDDAHVFAAIEQLVALGGFKGLGMTMASQRSAKVNNDLLTQAGTLFALRTPGEPDQKAIQAWFRNHPTGKEMMAELSSLPNGHAFVISPEFLPDRPITRLEIRRRRTYDSGATPKIGEQDTRPPVKLADFDFAAVQKAMAATIAQAEADDPAKLRQRIQELERQLAERPAAEPEIKEVPVLNDSDRALLIATGEALRTGLQPWWDSLQQLLAQVEPLFRKLHHSGVKVHELPAAAKEGGGKSPNRPAQSKTAPSTATTGKDPAGPAGGEPRGPAGPTDAVKLRAGARRMVETLGRMAPLRLTASQWGTLARLSTRGGTWTTYLGEIRRAGFLDENSDGYTLSDAGFEYLGGRPEPMSTAELQDHYRSILRRGAAAMMDALIRAYPQALTDRELSEEAGIATTGGTWTTYRGDLIRNGLAVRVDGGMKATAVLMGDL